MNVSDGMYANKVEVVSFIVKQLINFEIIILDFPFKR